MNYETIIYEKKEMVAIITFNRPAKKNAMSKQLMRELVEAVDNAQKDDAIKVLVLTGGPECFCAGADLSEVQQSKTGAPDEGAPDPMSKVKDFPKPTIAAIGGACVAGGIELALCCDIRIASETAKIGDGHIRMGLIGGGGSPVRIPRLIGESRAKELIFSGNLVDGKEAYNLGLVNRVYPKEKFMEEAMALANKIGAHSLTALKLTKKAIEQTVDMPEYHALHHATTVVNEMLASAEYKERVGAFLNQKK